VEDGGCGELRGAPVAEILLGEKGRVDRKAAAFLRKLSVEARLVLRAQRVGLRRLRLIAQGLVGAAQPVARAAHRDRAEDGVAERDEMVERGFEPAEAEGAIPGEPFQFGEGAVVAVPDRKWFAA
jgi:hypothetical protein